MTVLKALWMITILTISTSCIKNKAENITMENIPNPNINIISGVVIKTVSASGTLSEYHYFQLTSDNGSTSILFNTDKRSSGFETYLGKSVSIKGVTGEGVLGWKKKKAKGIIINTISENE